MLFTLIPVGDVQPVLTTNRFGYGEAESGRFLFLVPLVETFEDMLAVERFGLPCVGDSQRVCLDRDTDVSFSLLWIKAFFSRLEMSDSASVSFIVIFSRPCSSSEIWAL
mgnify:CR=1 FL=1